MEPQFSNVDGYRGGNKQALSFKSIVIEHIRRCVLNGSVEFRGGYWEDKSVNNGMIFRTYIPDTRATFWNGVLMLETILWGYLDDECAKQVGRIHKALDNGYEKVKKDKTDVNEWVDYKIKMYRRLFRELCLLSKRLNFYEEESGEESVGIVEESTEEKEDE